jgi:hypothetical protein
MAAKIPPTAGTAWSGVWDGAYGEITSGGRISCGRACRAVALLDAYLR